MRGGALYKVVTPEVTALGQNLYVCFRRCLGPLFLFAVASSNIHLPLSAGFSIGRSDLVIDERLHDDYS